MLVNILSALESTQKAKNKNSSHFGNDKLLYKKIHAEDHFIGKTPNQTSNWKVNGKKENLSVWVLMLLFKIYIFNL